MVKSFDFSKVEEGVKLILEGIGEDTTREGLLDTPKRVAKMYQEITVGLREPTFKLTAFKNEEKYNEMVLVRDIPFYSICEHHLVPFLGKAHVAYIPDKKYLGLSKLARIVHYFAAKPQVQERLTHEIASMLQASVNPLGVGVVIEAEHLCMSMRGVKTSGASTTTSSVQGAMFDDPKARSEFLKLISMR